MPVIQVFEFDDIAPQQTAGVFVHGFPFNWVGAFNAIPDIDLFPDGPAPHLPRINLVQTSQPGGAGFEIGIHTDGTWYRIALATNMATGSEPLGEAQGVGLYFFYEEMS
jgi:hypothetical protein